MDTGVRKLCVTLARREGGRGRGSRRSSADGSRRLVADCVGGRSCRDRTR